MLHPKERGRSAPLRRLPYSAVQIFVKALQDGIGIIGHCDRRIVEGGNAGDEFRLAANAFEPVVGHRPSKGEHAIFRMKPARPKGRRSVCQNAALRWRGRAQKNPSSGIALLLDQCWRERAISAGSEAEASRKPVICDGANHPLCAAVTAMPGWAFSCRTKLRQRNSLRSATNSAAVRNAAVAVTAIQAGTFLPPLLLAAAYCERRQASSSGRSDSKEAAAPWKFARPEPFKT